MRDVFEADLRGVEEGDRDITVTGNRLTVSGKRAAEVTRLMTAEALEALGQQMEAEAIAMMEAGEPRRLIRLETEAPAVQP